MNVPEPRRWLAGDAESDRRRFEELIAEFRRTMIDVCEATDVWTLGADLAARLDAAIVKSEPPEEIQRKRDANTVASAMAEPLPKDKTPYLT